MSNMGYVLLFGVFYMGQLIICCSKRLYMISCDLRPQLYELYITQKISKVQNNRNNWDKMQSVHQLINQDFNIFNH